MDNKHTGEVALNMGNEAYTIVFDWAALAKLKTAFTDTELDGVISGENIEMMAEVLAIGLQKHHKDITPEKVVELSPPLVAAVTALDKALTFAYFGPDGAPDTKSAQKKTHKK